MQNVDNLEGPSLCVVVNVAMLCVHVQKEHFEAEKAFETEARAIELVLVTHDFLEDISAATFV